MASRFVAAGAQPDSASTSDDWTKAKQDVETSRLASQAPKHRQDDGKSLYETLQANKAAKQEAFEEAAKLKNQFRSLDDSEIAFLESVQERERDKELLTKRETEEQLESFRKQRVAAEQAALKAAQRRDEPVDSATAVKSELWTSSKKRRRADKTEDDDQLVKHRKPSEVASPNTSTTHAQSVGKAASKPSIEHDQIPKPDANAKTAKQMIASTATSTGLGLGLAAYGSDDEDED